MATTTNQPYMNKSMNGIIIYDDGAGGSMEGGVITCNELDVPIINVNEVQPYNVSTNYNLFTNATSQINIGNTGIITYMLSPVISAMPIIAGQFNSNYGYLNNIESQTINTSTLNVSNVNVSVVTVGTENVTTLNASVGNISTLNASVGNISILNTDTITATAVGSTANVFNNITTGTINIGNNINNSVSGSGINIGVSPYNSAIIIGNNTGTAGVGELTLRTLGAMNVAKFASEINVGTGMTTGTISLGANTSSTSIINVGTLQFLGNNTGSTIDVIDGSSVNVSGVMRIAGKLTAGALRVGAAFTTGNIIIGNHNMTGTNEIRTGGVLQLGNQATSINMGTTSTNTINIANVSSITTIKGLTINMGSDSVLANSISIGNVSSTINTNAQITSTNASFINLGTATGTNTIAIGNVSSTLNINSPINPSYDTKYTAFAGTPSGCIGEFLFPDITIGNFDLTSTINKVGATFTNLPVGVWLFYWNAYFFVPTTIAAITSIALNMGESSGGSNILATVVSCATQNIAVNRTISYSVTQVYTNVSSAQDIFFSTTATFTGTLRILGLFSGTNCKAVRLA